MQKCNTFRMDYSILNLPNYRVYKHNDLVECKSDFSATEHRIIVIALAQITSHDEKLRMYKISIQDVLGNKPNRSNYNIVRNAVRRLHKSTIEIEEEDGWKSYAFITKAQGKYKSSFIEIQFHEDIQKFLLGLKSQYTTYTLENVIKFKKNYSLRIYELCKQYQKIGYRVLELDYLRTLLSLEKKYVEFFNFKNSVLKPSIEEINTHSDIELGFEERRNGKKVEFIKFIICKKKNISDKTLSEASLEREIQEKFHIIGFDIIEVEKIQKKYSFQRISDVIDLFEKNIRTIKFPKAWILKALKDNYVDSSEYQYRMSCKEKNLGKLKRKIAEITDQKRDIKNIQEQIFNIEEDIEYYQDTGCLKDGDFIRFGEELSIEKAIEKLKKRMNDCILEIEEKEKKLRILEDEKRLIKGNN